MGKLFQEPDREHKAFIASRRRSFTATAASSGRFSIPAKRLDKNAVSLDGIPTPPSAP